MTKVFDAYAMYYDLLYRDKDYLGESQFVQKLLLQHDVATGDILELGCGTGKHAHTLAHMGYNIHGVDLSSSMVAGAISLIPSDLAENIIFEEGDVRTLKLDRKFDAVISLFHVASYQTTNQDIAAMLHTASKHLNSGGIFIFDFWYGPAVLTDRPSIRVKRMENEVVSITRIAEPIMHPNENLVDVNYTVSIFNKDSGVTQSIQESHSVRYFFAPELSLMLEIAGFEISSMFEWMSGRQPGFDTWATTIVAIRR